MDKKLNICATALALLLLIPLVGCGGASDKGESVETAGHTSTTPAPIPPDSTTPTEESETEDEVIHVSTAGEFLEAIAPGVVIELAPGTYNLTEYLRGASDNVSDYVARGFTDGWQAEIHEVDMLTIRGADGAMSKSWRSPVIPMYSTLTTVPILSLRTSPSAIRLSRETARVQCLRLITAKKSVSTVWISTVAAPTAWWQTTQRALHSRTALFASAATASSTYAYAATPSLRAALLGITEALTC